jgi:UDP-galactopyranose mutase
MWTFNQLWGVTHPHEAKAIIAEQSKEIGEPQNLEEQAIKLVGRDVYEKLIKGYTSKQWMKPPNELPKEIIKRLPVRFTYDTNYFNDPYQGIPIGGYTQIFDQLLAGIEVQLETDYLADKSAWDAKGKNIIFTGPIDAYYDYQFGPLEYKTTRFEHKKLTDTDNYQGVAIMNYTDGEVPYTRIIEYKHFEFGQTDTTCITYEYPEPYVAKVTEPYYPVNDQANKALFSQYKALADAETHVYFGGRLAEYKYYDMHQIIDRAFDLLDELNS